MIRSALSISATGVLLLALGLAMPAQAQRYPGGWNGAGDWSGGDQRVATQAGAEPSRHIEVDAFRAADAGDVLGKGRIVVMAAPLAASPDEAPPPPSDRAPDMLPSNSDAAPLQDKLPVYEAAVIDKLAAHGYDTANANNPQQLVEVSVSHDVVVPEEAPHRPVSGEVSMGISNYGSGFGGALFIDLSKPRKAIIATRLEVRIRDRASQRVLWEGHAQGQARMTSGGFDDSHMATRLAEALFAKFPEGTVVAALPGRDLRASE